MKKLMIASVCIFALSTGGAFAQMQPAPGASIGAGATSAPKHANAPKHHAKHMNKGTTTGMGSGSAHSKSTSPSSSGTKNY